MCGIVGFPTGDRVELRALGIAGRAAVSWTVMVGTVERTLGRFDRPSARAVLAVRIECLPPGRLHRDGATASAVKVVPVSALLDPSAVRHGRVNGRYFRENFAQGGIDLVQIIPELVTNADAAIALGGRSAGRIVLRFGPPDPAFVAGWKRAMRQLRAPALLDWRHELRCADDGVGMDAAAVDRRLGALGVLPDAGGQRGLFGRGLRDVWARAGRRAPGGRARRAARGVVVLSLRRR